MFANEGINVLRLLPLYTNLQKIQIIRGILDIF